MRQEVAAPPAIASAAWHSARGCRPACALMRATRWARDEEKRWGSLENRPYVSGEAYFFFFAAFFFAAFFAFFAIVPPEEAGLCLMAASA